ncbi:MAG: metal ABC transporter substrate-binding protein [Planctomycetota bacterium]
MATKTWWSVLVPAAAIVASCGEAPTASQDDTATNNRSVDSGAADAAASSALPVVQTVNYPLAYFAERIAGDLTDVRFLSPEDGDPAFWMPSREAIAEIQSADVILANGATYAKWRGAVSLPASKIVDTSASFSDSFIEIKDAVVHSHGEGGEHSHAGTAFTTWLDMTQARAQAEAVRDAMLGALPGSAEVINANADALLADIDALDAEFRSASESLAGVPLVASHPVYQYFSRRYGLNVESLHWEPEMTMTAENTAELAELRETHAAGWMLWEGEPTDANVAALAGEGVQSVIIDPCGNRPGEGDWLSVMRDNVEALRSIQP